MTRRAEIVDDVLADLEAVGAGTRPDRRDEVGGVASAGIAHGGDGGRDDRLARTAPPGVDGRHGGPAAIGDEHGHAVGDAHGQGRAGVVGDERVSLWRMFAPGHRLVAPHDADEAGMHLVDTRRRSGATPSNVASSTVRAAAPGSVDRKLASRVVKTCGATPASGPQKRARPRRVSITSTRASNGCGITLGIIARRGQAAWAPDRRRLDMDIVGIGTDACRRSTASPPRSRSTAIGSCGRSTPRAKSRTAGGSRNPPRRSRPASRPEAAAKALGTGIARGVFWTDIEVVRGRGGPPSIVFHGGAAERFAAIGGNASLLTLTHARDLAIAHVLLMVR